jgi:hypothetical protein
MREDPFVKKST